MTKTTINKPASWVLQRIDFMEGSEPHPNQFEALRKGLDIALAEERVVMAEMIYESLRSMQMEPEAGSTYAEIIDHAVRGEVWSPVDGWVKADGWKVPA